MEVDLGTDGGVMADDDFTLVIALHVSRSPFGKLSGQKIIPGEEQERKRTRSARETGIPSLITISYNTFDSVQSAPNTRWFRDDVAPDFPGATL